MLPLLVHRLIQVLKGVLQSLSFAVLLLLELQVDHQGFIYFLEQLLDFLPDSHLEQAIHLILWLQVFIFLDTKREGLSSPPYDVRQMEQY